jgi:hypothetical protein
MSKSTITIGDKKNERIQRRKSLITYELFI